MYRKYIIERLVSKISECLGMLQKFRAIYHLWNGSFMKQASEICVKIQLCLKPWICHDAIQHAHSFCFDFCHFSLIHSFSYSNNKSVASEASSSVVYREKKTEHEWPDPAWHITARLRDLCISLRLCIRFQPTSAAEIKFSNFHGVCPFTGGWVHSSCLDHSRNWLIWGFTLAGSVCHGRDVKTGR